MAWIDNYSTGIEEIDIQHRELFEVIMKFKSSFKEPTSNMDEEVIKILRYLVSYTMFHFDSEEEYMRRISYNQITEHKKIHENFIKKIKDILVQQKVGKLFKPVFLYNFLTDWLREHIAKEDQKYVVAGGNIKSHKITLGNKEDVLQSVNLSLSHLEIMTNDGLITDQERTSKRRIYLKSFYNGCKIGSLTDLYVLLESCSFLLEHEIITHDENKELKKYIVGIVDITNKLAKEKDGNFRKKIEEYLILHNLYKRD